MEWLEISMMDPQFVILLQRARPSDLLSEAWLGLNRAMSIFQTAGVSIALFKGIWELSTVRW